MIKGRPLSFDREAVLDKALELFWHRGYESLGMSELLEEMGIPRQSFYNTFGNKEEVFLEAFQLYCRRMRTTFVGILASANSPLDGLHKMFDYIEGMAQNNECAGCLVGNTLAEFGQHNPRISAAVEEAMAAKEDMLIGAFQAAIDAGELKTSHTAHALATTMMTLNQGLALMSKSGRPPEDLLRTLQTTRELLLN